VLLRREPERVDERLAVALGLAGELEAADRLRALDQFLLVERQVVEVRPPLRLLLAAVVVEEVREQLASDPSDTRANPEYRVPSDCRVR
jgi:hypothetical protein